MARGGTYAVVVEFLLAVIDTATTTATGSEMAAIDAFNDQLREKGQLRHLGGLTDPSQCAAFQFDPSSEEVFELPLAIRDEHMAGFWILSTDSLDVARELASEAARACRRKIELRPFLGGGSA